MRIMDFLVQAEIINGIYGNTLKQLSYKDNQ